MGEQKKYKEQQVQPTYAGEPIAVGYVNAATSIVSEKKENRRDDISRAITGDMLLDRLRPRIKSMFE